MLPADALSTFETTSNAWSVVHTIILALLLSGICLILTAAIASIWAWFHRAGVITFVLTALATIVVLALALTLTTVNMLISNLLGNLDGLGFTVEGGKDIVWLVWSAVLMLCFNGAVCFFIMLD